VLTSLAAAPRCDDADTKLGLTALAVLPARVVDGVFVEEGYLFLECELGRVVDGFGENSLVTGRVVAAYADEEAIRTSERDDGEVLRSAPLLAYLSPGRYTEIRGGHAFPFPAGFRR
jgi:flavin reductase (DIM6/NTAB) family NADH-FMN oxidoreductase RutF